MRLSSARASRMAKRPRTDTQKSKVYAAGWLLPEDTVGTTQKEVQAYVDRVTDLTWFRRRWGAKRMTVELKRGQGGYNPAYSSTIVIGQNATGIMGTTPGAARRTVLHEMAHVLVGPCNGNWHGPEFARVQLELVSFAYGPEQAKVLRDGYKANKVKLGSPTPLRPVEKVPPPRPQPKTWRAVVQTPSGEVVVLIEANSLKGAIDRLNSSHTEQLRQATDVHVYKSRAVSTRAAAKPPRKARR